MNARMPSRWSWVPKSPMKSSFSRAIPAGPGLLTAAWIASLAAASARRGPWANARRVLDGRLEHLVRGEDPLDQPERPGLLGIHLPTRVRQIPRDTDPREPRHPLGSSCAGDHPEPDLGLSDLRVVGGIAKVTGERELEPAARARSP